MNKLYRVSIKGLWGYKNSRIDINEKVNFFYGVNGSGKTTIINIIVSAITVNLKKIQEIPFDSALLSFTGGQVISLKKGKDNALMEVYCDDKIYECDIEGDDFIFDTKADYIRERISEFVSLDWLPLSRNHNDDEMDMYLMQDHVDEKLTSITSDLVSKFSRTAKIYASITSKFQRNIYEKLLEVPSENDITTFKTDLDSDEKALREISSSLFPSDNVDRDKKIDNYIKSLSDVYSDRKARGHGQNYSISDIGVIFNAWRTTSLIKDYEVLKKKKQDLFRNQNSFFNVLKMFFKEDKEIVLSPDNKIIMKTKKGNVSLSNLSSGEKQIIILLGQIYLSDNKNVIYVADEPEVSLHVSWQDKLVDALVAIKPDAQIILATHSPDIIGRRKELAVGI